MRDGDWKYLRDGEMEFLFDLAADSREQANRKLREPERFEAMRRRYADWEATMLPYPPQAWPGILAVKSSFRNLDR